MKRVLLSITLVLSMILTLASCDMLGDALGSIFGREDVPAEQDNIGVNNGNVTKPRDEEEDPEEPDDPVKNVSSIVSSVNKGINLGSLVETEEIETVNVEEAVDQWRQAIKDVAFSKNYSFNAVNNADGGEETVTANGYVGVSDGVIKVTEEGSDVYMYFFIEDDFKIVTVAKDEYGYYTDVEDSLYEYVEQLLSMNDAEQEIDEDTQKAMQFIEKICEIQLPKIEKKDVTYNEDDGRYYLSDEYTEKAIHEVSKKVLEDYYEIYPEETPEDIYEGLEEGIAETLKVLNLEIWLNAKHENITGFGLSVYINGKEIADEESTTPENDETYGETEEYDETATEDADNEIKSISATLNVENNTVTFNAVIEPEEGYDIGGTVNATLSYGQNYFDASAEVKYTTEEGSFDARVSCTLSSTDAAAEFYVKTTGEEESDNVEMSLKASMTVGEDSLPEKVSFELDVTGSDTQYEEEEVYNGYYTDYNTIYLYGKTTLHFAFTADMTNIEKGGQVAKLECNMSSGDYKAYVESYDYESYTYEEEFSQEYTDKYNFSETTVIDIEVVSEEQGNRITVGGVFEIDTTKAGETDTNVSMSATLETAETFEIPADVQESRQDALDNYIWEEMEETTEYDY